uniref:40S ribosomal protein S7 n=1 Tax=Bicosoecida sp. CB-2014 TaxID=1486930 RepID=A0A7S1C3R4_9STRA|mmetsp:Transcript_12582/g.44050  ORF Transcript_12582/g.44050 Transcript_12582/m.44050 type:complete len:195 (+) Transcript_12582:43-627(+)
MFSGSGKIVKADDKITDFEQRVAQELFNLELNNSNLKSDLHDLYITAAREVDVDESKKAIILFVPHKLLPKYHKVQKALVEELEKKFSGAHVVIIAQRTMFKASFTRNKRFTGPRPRSRTLKAVHEATLEDLVYPTEIVGKRIRVKTDGSKVMKVHLNPKDQVNVETKLETFSAVYSILTNKDVVFEFPVTRDE